MINKVFDDKGDFVAFHKAENCLKEQEYSIGRMCGEEPIGIKKGKWDIMKWRNLSNEDIDQLDGQIEGDMRNGPVKVIIKE